MATQTKAGWRCVDGHMETTKLLIANGASWNAGQPLHTVSGGLTASASDAVNFKYLSLTTQTDPGNATTEAEVGVITSDLKFEANELDATSASEAWKGGCYGIDVTSNIACVDVGETSAISVQIDDVGYLYEPIKNSASDTYPRVKFHVLQLVLDAAGS